MSELVDDALGRRNLEKWIAKEWARKRSYQMICMNH